MSCNTLLHLLAARLTGLPIALSGPSSAGSPAAFGTFIVDETEKWAKSSEPLGSSPSDRGPSSDGPSRVL
jgi:hypothetical protein